MQKIKIKVQPTPYWTGVLRRAMERIRAGVVPFTVGQQMKSADWQDCACGRQDPRIERLSDGRPTDDILDAQGMEFYRGVERAREAFFDGAPKTDQRAQVRRAARAMKAIERRSGYIIRCVEADNEVPA